MLSSSVEAWNRGDLVAFTSYYEDSPETTYVSREVVRGHKAILERYRKHYPNREAMGTLTFSNVEVRQAPVSFLASSASAAERILPSVFSSFSSLEGKKRMARRVLPSSTRYD